jgi:hypothetical protein
LSQVLDDGRVVDEFTQNGDWAGGGGEFGVPDGITDAKAPTKMGCAMEFHGMLCNTK